MITALMAVAYFVSSLPYTVVVGGILAIIAIWAVIRWGEHMGKIRDPLKQQLDMASHGAGMALLLPFVVHRASMEGYFYYLPPTWHGYVWPACYVLMAFGVYMLVIGAARSRSNFRDANLMARSGIKIAVGIAIGFTIYQGILPPEDWRWTYRHYAFWVLMFVAAWCLTTGVVKVLLLMRGPPGLPDAANPMPHGDASHPTRGGLG